MQQAAGCCSSSSLQTGHVTVSSPSYRQPENQSTKYHRQHHLYNTLELLMMGIVLPESCWACNKYHLLHLVGILFPHKIGVVFNSFVICVFVLYTEVLGKLSVEFCYKTCSSDQDLFWGSWDKILQRQVCTHYPDICNNFFALPT